MTKVPVHISEDYLVAQLVAGDQEARQFVYDKYSPALYGVILQVIPEEKLANDVLVRLFVHVFKNAKLYTTSGHFTLFGWLMKVTREFVTQAIPPSISTSVNTQSPILRPKENSLIQFMRNLPPDAQRIFELCYRKGLSQAAAANVVGLSEEEVSVLLRSAMVELRKFMQK
ncbi:sigma-70 family RNA polymerase sigma factor [Chitinophaga horti]|uniref:Sigma-70 family RNA polymerase sigma factor n=1 Tax=Chitinophaga horti TaxID=2920382 RepID=A0ABY6J8X7_9BACT|nr:sigma-70 family RNA polymerase sigma factor [Chitinophaga horti]UYQ95032.1 sigma-70 family RNA polymerase sigma factor [Chitinophaga horti]